MSIIVLILRTYSNTPHNKEVTVKYKHLNSVYLYIQEGFKREIVLDDKINMGVVSLTICLVAEKLSSQDVGSTLHSCKNCLFYHTSRPKALSSLLLYLLVLSRYSLRVFATNTIFLHFPMSRTIIILS